MKHLSPVLICAFVFLSLQFYAQSAEEYRTMARKAVAVLDYSTAMKMLNKGLEISPVDAGLLSDRADILLEMQKYDKAREDIDAVMRADSNVVGANLGLSKYYRYTNQPDSAIYFALKAIALSEDKQWKSRSEVYLATAYREYGEDSLAMVYLVRGLENDQKNVTGYKNAAEICIENGDMEGAYAYLQKANLYMQEDMETLINLSYVANQLEYPREALEYCNQALNLDGQHPLALSNRSGAYIQLNEMDLAWADIQKSFANSKSNPLAYRYAGEIQMAKGNASKACKYFKEAQKLGYTSLHGDYVDAQVAEKCVD